MRMISWEVVFVFNVQTLGAQIARLARKHRVPCGLVEIVVVIGDRDRLVPSSSGWELGTRAAIYTAGLTGPQEHERHHGGREA
jgi:hypothetical protein